MKDNNNINVLMQRLSEQLGASPEKLSNIAKNGRIEEVLSPQQTMQVKKVLADENAIKKLLSSKQAQELLKGLKKNE